MGLLLEKVSPSSREEAKLVLRPDVKSFHAAVRRGNLGFVAETVSRGYDLHETDTYGQSALHVAAEFRRLAVTKFLLSHGADPAAQDSSYLTALHVAAALGHLATLQVLLDHPAGAASIDATDVWGRTALFKALVNDETEASRLLLERGADVNVAAGDGRVCLHVAASYGLPHAALLLLRHGATVDSLDKQKRSPLHMAVVGRHLPLVRLLVSEGADLTPPYLGLLGRAAASGRGQEAREAAGTRDFMVAQLLRLGVDVRQGAAALLQPSCLSNEHCVRVLITQLRACPGPPSAPGVDVVEDLARGYRDPRHEDQLVFLRALHVVLAAGYREPSPPSNENAPQSDETLTDWRNRYQKGPVRLAVLCVRAVRGACQKNVLWAAPQLPIPDALKRAVTLEDALSVVGVS